MTTLDDRIAIRTDADQVGPFVDTVCRCADNESDALGFIPHSAYREAAVQGKLWVAVFSRGGTGQYVGHLLFGGAFPKLRVFQLFVDKSVRRQGVGTALIARLVEEAEALNYLSIVARVADDLEANRFWERERFVVVGCERGGASTNRMILLRERRLSTPTLFDLLNASVTPTDHDLRLADRLYSRSPNYIFDVNVLLDIAKDRPRAAEVARIFAAAMANSIQLYVAPEFLSELRKSAPPLGQDPLLQFATTLPQFPAPPVSEGKRVCLELGALVFPERTRQQRLKPRDESDLMHLATAIHHKADGFITSEKAILRCRRIFREKYGLDVVGVPELAEALTPRQWAEHDHLTAATPVGGEINAAELKEQERCRAEEFLKSVGIEDNLRGDVLAPGHSGALRRRLLICSSDSVVAYTSWDAPQRVCPLIEGFVFAKETVPLAESAVEYSLFLMTKDASQHGPSLLRVRTKTSSTAMRLASCFGFRSATAAGHSSDEILFQKICLGRVVDESNWESIRRQLSDLAGIGLPPAPPKYRGSDTVMTLTSPQGVPLCLPLAELEDLLGPALMVLPDRPGAIVPIRRPYAEQLLDTSAQGQLFPKYEAALFSRRTYFSAVRALPSLRPGTVLLFYESRNDGGRGAIVACARAVENAVQRPREVSDAVKRRGVLEDAPILRIGRHGKTGITQFDSVMRFTNPVSLTRLREIGAARNNFMTSLKISHDQLISVLLEGQPHV